MCIKLWLSCMGLGFKNHNYSAKSCLVNSHNYSSSFGVILSRKPLKLLDGTCFSEILLWIGSQLLG